MAHVEENGIALDRLTAQQIEDGILRTVPGGEIDAALRNKANWNGGVLSGGANVLDWALTQEINTCCSCDNTVTGVPISGYWMMRLRVYPGAGWRILEAHNVLTGCSYSNTYNVRAWDGWIGPLATATPPQEHDLPLAAGKVGVEYNSFRKWQNGRVALFVAIQRADGAELSGIESAFTLPKECRPYRHEVRRIDLSGADGNPAGYAHLHIYPDGNANIAGIVTRAKTAFCECGFWMA